METQWGEWDTFQSFPYIGQKGIGGPICHTWKGKCMDIPVYDEDACEKSRVTHLLLHQLEKKGWSYFIWHKQNTEK